MNTQWSRGLFWLFSCWLLLGGTAWADGYNKGLNAYRDGEYSKAYKILSGVVKKAKDKSDKAEAMALMGASAAKMGKKSKAESLFSKASKLDPDVSLPKDAAKDKTIRKLFSKSRKGGGDDDMGDDGFEGKSEKSASKGGIVQGLIPFGVGYIYNGEISKGLIYGGAQVAGLVGFLYYSGEINKANADADAIGQDALAQKAQGKAPDPQTTDFLDQNEAFVKAAQNNQKLMIAILGAGYGLSVLDSIIFGSSKKSSKRRAEILLNPAHALADGEKPDSNTDVETMEEAPRVWDMKLHLLPRRDPALMLSINRSF